MAVVFITTGTCGMWAWLRFSFVVSSVYRGMCTFQSWMSPVILCALHPYCICAYIAVSLNRQSAGKFAAGLQTGLCKQAYACNKFHYFVRRESETTFRLKTRTCKRGVTLSLDHWYEQVHTLTIAQAGA